jgi:hypothetical protein
VELNPGETWKNLDRNLEKLGETWKNLEKLGKTWIETCKKLGQKLGKTWRNLEKL